MTRRAAIEPNASCYRRSLIDRSMRYVSGGDAALTAETWLRTRPYSVALTPPPHPRVPPSSVARPPSTPLALRFDPLRRTANLATPMSLAQPFHPPLRLPSRHHRHPQPYRITRAFWCKRSKDQPRCVLRVCFGISCAKIERVGNEFARDRWFPRRACPWLFRWGIFCCFCRTGVDRFF